MKLLSQVEVERLIDKQEEGARKQIAINAHNDWVERGLYETNPALTLDGGALIWSTTSVSGYWHGERSVTFETDVGQGKCMELIWAAQSVALDNHMERRKGWCVSSRVQWHSVTSPVYFARSVMNDHYAFYIDMPLFATKESSEEWFAKLAKEPQLAIPPSEEGVAECVNLDCIDNRGRCSAKQARMFFKLHPQIESNWFRHLIT